MEYEVVWNGVNDGHDGDLLRSDIALPDKFLGGLLRSNKGHRDAFDRVRDALPTTRERAMTFREIVTDTGCNGSTVNTALYRLRQEGALCSDVIPGPTSFRKSRPPQVYWRRALP